MKHNFGVAIEVDNRTGELLAAYFQVRKGKSAETKEFDGGNVFVDYNDKGELLGIEMLAPSRVKLLDKITIDEPATRQFVKNAAPRELVLA